MSKSIVLRQVEGHHAVCKLSPQSPIPEWADGKGFVSISRTASELSIICRAERVPEAMNASRAWVCFEFVGPFGFDETGIALAGIQPLSANQIGFLLVATFDTDYLLVQEKDVSKAKDALRAAGHRLITA